MHPFVIPTMSSSSEKLKEFGKAEFGFLVCQFQQGLDNRLIGSGFRLIAIDRA